MAEKIAQMSTALVYVLLFVVSVVGAYLLYTLSQMSQKVVAKGEGQVKKGRRTLGCLTTIFLLLVVLSFLFFTAYLRAYHVFTKEELVAVVECLPAKDRDVNFVLKLTPVVDGQPQPAEFFPIKGEQWAIGGDILKWKPPMNLIGIHTMYRLTRIEGRYRRAADQQSLPSSAYSLTEEESSFWRLMYEIGDRLPLVESSYGNTVYTEPSFRDKFQVYVSISGFMLKKARGDQSSFAKDVMDKVLDAAFPELRRGVRR